MMERSDTRRPEEEGKKLIEDTKVTACRITIKENKISTVTKREVGLERLLTEEVDTKRARI